MNIIKSNPFLGTQAGMQEAGLGANLGNIQASLDPETLKLLQNQSLAKGVDFNQLLEATKQGHDPEELLKVLASESQTKLDNLENAEGEVETSQQYSQFSVHTQVQNMAMQDGIIVDQNKVEMQDSKAELFNVLKKGEAPAEVSGLQKRKITTKHQLNNQQPLEANLSQVKALSGDGLRPNIMSAAALSLEGMPKNKVGKNITADKKDNLLRLDDFIAQQSPSLKKNAAAQAYKVMPKSMFEQKIENSLPAVAKAPTQTTSLQDIMLGQAETNGEDSFSPALNHPQLAESLENTKSTTSNAKVFDISSLTSNDSSDEILAKVENYIIQTRASKEPQVDVSFVDKQLGMVDLQIKKMEGSDQLNIIIASHKSEGMDFFNRHQGELLGKLSQAGIQVGDLKLESGSSQSNQSQDQAKQQFANQEGRGQHQSQSGQRESDARRRQELWQQFSEKEVA